MQGAPSQPTLCPGRQEARRELATGGPIINGVSTVGRQSNGRGGRARLQSRIAGSLAQFRADISFAVVDAILIALSYMTALALRSLDGGLPAVWWPRVLNAIPIIVGVHLVSNIVMGAYGHVWEYASIAEARRVIAATFWASLTLILGTFALGIRPVPLSVLTAGALITLACLGVVRFRSRLFSFHRTLDVDARDRVLILGTGHQAADVARNATVGPHAVNVVGFVSPLAVPSVRRLAGLPVLGLLEEIASLVREFKIDQVVVASDGAATLAKQLVDLCVDVDVQLRIVPDLDEVLRGGGPDIRDLQLDDLLLRERVSTDMQLVESTLSGKRVLVTGAGGSIGSEIVAQVLRFMPERLIAVDHDETHLHDGRLEWDPPAGTKIVSALADIRDERAIERLIRREKPDVVYHAAAHKHVPILEQWPDEAIKTNVIGTVNLLRAIKGTNVERFVLISTDKTVDPQGVMGASKRVAEMLVQSAAVTDGEACHFASVRFGNVLGSRGSVVPTFMEQIRTGGPVTITDERMTRYFMTTDEAVELVLQAGALASGGEVFVLDMGQPVRIVDLAHRMIRLAGLVPGRDIEVKITGARPGEKLVEELSHGELIESEHPKINIAATECPGPVTLHDMIGQMEKKAASGRSSELKRMLLTVANLRWSSDETVDLRELEQVPEWT